MAEIPTTTKDLGAVFDAHVRAEFVDKDVATTMATMTTEPYLTHVPTMTGGTGRAEVERFEKRQFLTTRYTALAPDQFKRRD